MEPKWVNEEAALLLHARLIARYGGTDGIRDAGLLQSALARPMQHYAYAGCTDLIQLAAIVTFGIVRNHPFLDGNKRTGFAVGAVFLRINGYRLEAPEPLVVEAVLALAAGESGEPEYAAFLRRWTTAPSAPAQTPSPGA